jgi:hypothetical protein
MINMQNFDYAIADTPGTMRVGGGAHYGTLIPALYNASAELRSSTLVPFPKIVITLLKPLVSLLV